MLFCLRNSTNLSKALKTTGSLTRGCACQPLCVDVLHFSSLPITMCNACCAVMLTCVVCTYLLQMPFLISLWPSKAFLAWQFLLVLVDPYSVSLCVHTDIPTYRHTVIRTQTHGQTYMQTQTYTHTHRHTHIYRQTDTHAHTYRQTDMRVHTHTHTLHTAHAHAHAHTFP